MFRFGIMGAGNIAEKFCQAVKLTGGAEVAAMASKSADRAVAFASKHGIPGHYGCYEEMLQREALDAVYIATTNNFHYENIMTCLDFQTPVLCEKAMFLSSKEAVQAIDRAKAEGIFMMEGMWTRFLPAVQTARAWIAEGRIGRLQTAAYTGGIHAPRDHRIFVPELGGGAMYDLMVYPLEILLFLVNQPLLTVRADICFGETGVDIADSLLLQFETCRAALQVTTSARIPSPCGLYGDKGYIHMEQTHRASAAELYDEQFKLVERFEYPVENGFEFEIQEVMRCVRENAAESSVMPLSDTLKCTEIFEQAFGLC